MFEWLKKKTKPPIDDFDAQLLSSNLVGAKTLSELNERERRLTGIRQKELKNNPIKGNFDYQHLKDIHKYIFQDVYSWAGQDRYDIGIRDVFRKGDSYFTTGEDIPLVAKALFDSLKDENYFKDTSKDEFVKNISSFMNGLNILHPFREGNGRTQRIFLEELALNASYKLDLSNIPQNEIYFASKFGMKGRYEGFQVMVNKNIEVIKPNR